MTLKESVKALPHNAGVYQYFDKDGKILYVGKAKNLSKRVKSYFIYLPEFGANPSLSTRIKKMIEQAHSLSYIVVNSEHDALVLENSLIKQLNPKYNILLRDDKTYPYIYIDYAAPYPRFEITRKVVKSKQTKYFGPYSVGARDILDSVYELCALVQQKGSLKQKKICLYHHIGRCLAPCELEVSKERYNKELAYALELIANKKTLLAKLNEKMLFYADELRFEEAMVLRERIERIGRSEIKSEIDFATNENFDVFAIEMIGSRGVVVRMFMRDGKIVSSSHSHLTLSEDGDKEEAYERALVEFYSANEPLIATQILVADEFENRTIIEEYLGGRIGKKMSIKMPKVGNKKELVELALLNARELLKLDQTKSEDSVWLDIQELFALEKAPRRVEVFDNSHMAGMATVGAMIVWENGAYNKKSYRTYHLDAKDEYAQMRELLMKRVASFEKNPPPDLWIIDGGSTLLSLANDIVASSGVRVDVIAISKEKSGLASRRAKSGASDTLHSKDDNFKLMKSDKRLLWVQKLRDEAHRCAISFHKKTKVKLDTQSSLLELHGISQAKVVKLLKHFGSFEALKDAKIDDIRAILSAKDALVIKSIYK